MRCRVGEKFESGARVEVDAAETTEVQGCTREMAWLDVGRAYVR